MRILLVEDSPRVVETLTAALTREGHKVEVAGSCATARDAFGAAEFELAIIDIGLPDGSGLDVCRGARREGHALPILLLTARTDVSDRVLGLDAGADDYLAKPFAPAELHARVRALGRRGPSYRDTVLTFGDLVIDGDRREVTRRGARIPLTARELDIVTLLATRRGRVVLRDEILDCVWGDVSTSAAASLEVLVARIRRKIDEGGAGGSCIRTHRTVGYAWQLEAS